MAIHKLFSKILLIQTYHTTCVSFSCEFISLISVTMYYLDKAVQDKKVAKSSQILLYLNTLCYHVKWLKSPSVGTRPRMLLCMWLMYGDLSMTLNKLTRCFSPDPFLSLVQLVALVAE